MRITVFGAAGAVGREVVAEAVRRGHVVTALGRAAADARDAGAVAELSVGQDIVVTATRPAPGQEHELVTTVRAQLTALAGTGVRLFVVGGAATLRTPNGATVLDEPDFPAELRPIAAACAEQLAVCAANTTVDWTYLSPPALLEPGPRTGRYRTGTDNLLVSDDGRSWISTADLAVAVLDEAQARNYPRARFTVGY